MQNPPVVGLFEAAFLWGLTMLPLKVVLERGVRGVVLAVHEYLVSFAMLLAWLWWQCQY